MPFFSFECISYSSGFIMLRISSMNCSLGLAAGVYSGLTYGLREARGSNDWVSSSSALVLPFFPFLG